MILAMLRFESCSLNNKNSNSRHCQLWLGLACGGLVKQRVVFTLSSKAQSSWLFEGPVKQRVVFTLSSKAQSSWLFDGPVKLHIIFIVVLKAQSSISKFQAYRLSSFPLIVERRT